jgi:Ca2+-transporting ATPase
MTNSPAIEKPHAASSEAVLTALNASAQGLGAEEALQRLAAYGPNTLHEEQTSRWTILLRQFNNIMVYVLLAASGLSLILGDEKDFMIILGLVLFNALLGFWQELKAEASIAALKKMTESRCHVLRGGKRIEIPSSQLVPGDLIELADGDLVSADLRLVEATGLLADESPITGESLPVSKDPRAVLAEKAKPYELDNMLLAGTSVVRGQGTAVVVRTGRHTYFASIAEKSKEASPETPLTRAMQHFSRRYVLLILALLTGVGLLDFLRGRALAEIAYTWVAQLISAVPEGLPLVVTLVMVVGALALSRKKTLARYLPAVETLGSATVIASDKTGTITEGRLKIRATVSDDPERLRLAAALCNDSRGGTGDPVDVALAEWVGAEYETLRAQSPRKETYPYESALKRMAAVHEIGGKPALFIKGAYEVLKKLDPEADGARWEAELEAMAEKGLRVLAFGQGEAGPEPWRVRIVGLIGFADPAKAGVKDAVATAKKAGLRVIMITGDHAATARSIARDAGIWQEGDGVLSGDDLDGMDDAALNAALKKTTVLARILPEQKYRVVKVLQEHREIVAVTGDGVNDVPALKAADLGIAMGRGTEAAKSVAKMIILDDNLGVIVDAIRNGRVIADNLRKVIYYLVSTNLNQLTLVSASILFGMPLPILPIQILWVNLVTDGVQDKTFPFAKEEGGVMARRPRPVENQFFDRAQMLRILFFGLSMGSIHLFLFHYLRGVYDPKTAVSVTFTSVVVTQWFNGIQAQLENAPFFKDLRASLVINPLIFASVGAGLLLQLTALYLLPDWFHVTPLGAEHWGYVLLSASMGFVLIELRKWAEFFWTRRRAAAC